MEGRYGGTVRRDGTEGRYGGLDGTEKRCAGIVRTNGRTTRGDGGPSSSASYVSSIFSVLNNAVKAFRQHVVCNMQMRTYIEYVCLLLESCLCTFCLVHFSKRQDDIMLNYGKQHNRLLIKTAMPLM